ncbi:MaoC/PaaZ C-terminal domain-containing protein [Fredinandcohnia onubensis]|uniref:MaoC/PaaZ C-terminal domain-containing protein n=1 Tax=Fredinandcohnia onubensis TaxID=1571209 RepID=UPI000C0BC7B0|nr:MaoC/PaaZ C-terminal domain-containing protein [Fredinandcohnia onubensis]
MQWSEFEINQELKPLVKPPIEKVHLVQYAGASGDFNLIHTDEETAKNAGLPGVIAHGMLSVGYIGQLLTNLAGNKGFVSNLNVRFTGMIFPGDVVTCRAKVVAKDEENKTIVFKISSETPEKQVITGDATITFYH